MSQILKLDNEHVQYVYDNAELVLDPSELNEDIIYSDGTQAILVNGQILHGEGQTIVLQEGEDLTQYYVNDHCEQIFIADENELSSANHLVEDGNIVQYIEEGESNGENEVVYIANDEEFIVPAVEDDAVEGASFPVNVVDIDDILRQQNGGASAAIMDPATANGEYQYAVLRDGKLHIQTYDSGHMELEQEEQKLSEMDAQMLDLSQITGKNLLTGQTVTLYNYIDKLQKKSKQVKCEKEENDLTNLLNKKIPLCKPVNGKRLVGKIISIERQKSETPAPPIQNDPVDIKQEEVVAEAVEKIATTTKEEEEHISRTLVGIMGMDSVRKKLVSKNIVVKLLEKSYGKNNELKKRVLYSGGYMAEKLNDNHELSWVYIPENLLDASESRFKDTIHVTIQLTILSNGQRQVKVILNDNFECKYCLKKFNNQAQVKSHMKTCPQNNDGKFWCSPCAKSFPTCQKLERHNVTTHKNRVYECETCLQRFANMVTLKKHMLTHDPQSPYVCIVCNKKFNNSADFNYHKRIHDIGNFFQCDTCGRSFSRYSNLMRHVEIHKGNEALYQCDICGSSYNYISSLTRHVVQNHINKDEQTS